MDDSLTTAFERFAARPHAPGALPGLEASLDALHALSLNEGAAALHALEALLADHAGRHPAIDAWLALARLCLSDAAARALALAAVDSALDGAPPFTRLVVGAEAARMVSRSDGAAPAWRRLAALGVEAALTAVSPLSDLQRSSALLAQAVCTTLELAAQGGASGDHETLATAATSLWPAAHPSALRVTLSLANTAILRGRYQEALRRIHPVEDTARGDLRALLLCTRLHALIALGRGSDEGATETLRALLQARRAAPEPEYELPEEERSALWARAERLSSFTRELRDMAEELEDSTADREAPPAGSADEAPAAAGLSDLLRREQEAKGYKNERRARALLQVLNDAEDLMVRPEAASFPEVWIRLRLLWCRLVVELGLHEIFDGCEQMLADVLDDTCRLGLAPLEMLAHDQRAVLRSRRDPADWPGALLDSSAAVNLAIQQIAENAGAAGSDLGAERALLESLLPVLDRVIDLHAEGAARVGARHPELLDRPLRKLDARWLDEDSARGTWLRFGLILHAYAEQTQRLALEEARRAYADGRAAPRRFAVASAEKPAIVTDTLRAALRPGDGVLQYLVVSRYVLVFAYGRELFDWYISVIEEGDSAERAVEELLHALRPWIQGGAAPEHASDVGKLQALLLPGKIAAALDAARVQHLRIVPHGALYRVPFGRLALGPAYLVERFSLSLHPTGQLAAASAASGRTAARPQRRSLLGYVVGPENEPAPRAGDPGDSLALAAPEPVRCAEREEQALRRGAGAVAPLVKVSRIDGVTSSLDQVLAGMAACGLLHVTCHGSEGGAHDQQPSMKLGNDERAGLEPRALLEARLDGCALVFLQSCSTGWMEHKRTNPVQGFPQAFCEAGARAVIAPLIKVPQALAPIFTGVFYRALRFLPAEEALQRALSVLRAHGSVLVASDPEAQEAWDEHGSTMDNFEYRYTGETGITLGGLASRCVGRVSFAWFEWRLRRAGRAALPRDRELRGLDEGVVR
ncbi:CHAT domain-containing protein [Sorangium sp. So ce291]|uniref:CHAT domain-containing protein n=1 Tax=Sorangium sp. So ce291 TaxID=3133294 RepID=UPI003F6083D9